MSWRNGAAAQYNRVLSIMRDTMDKMLFVSCRNQLIVSNEARLWKKPRVHNFCASVFLIIETLQILGGSGQPKEVTDTVLERLHISEREQAQTLKNGGSSVRNQVAWARFYLAKADLLDASRRGVWALTEKGRTVHLTPNAVMQLFKDVQANIPTKDEQPNATDDTTEITPPIDPSGDRASKRTLLDVGRPEVAFAWGI
jgi:hypothetical protein